MQEINLQNITIDKLSLPLLTKKKVEADVLRLDKIHPLVSGNKWFKLRYYLEEVKKQGKKTIVTYGGAWSNHIIATAAACKINGLNTIGIIRGEEVPHLSATLMEAKELGMRLFFSSREDYKNENVPDELKGNEYYHIPAGGYGIIGTEGAATILNFCKKENYTDICCAAGTGTMTAGLIKNSLPTNRIISISVLKNNPDIEKSIRLLNGNNTKEFRFINDYHFGGYAKQKTALIDFMNEFFRQTGIPSDFVYTGKLFFAVNDLINNNFFPPGSKLLIVHSGGLQGNVSLSKGTLIF